MLGGGGGGGGRAVLLRDAGLRCDLLRFFTWHHDGLEGSGDGISAPGPQADHLPGQRVQLLARQPALLTCNKDKGGWGEGGGLGFGVRPTFRVRASDGFWRQLATHQT